MTDACFNLETPPDAPAKKKQKRGKSSLTKIGEGIRLFTEIAFDGALKEELDREYVQAQRASVCTKGRLGEVLDRHNVSGHSLSKLSRVFLPKNAPKNTQGILLNNNVVSIYLLVTEINVVE